MSLSPRSRNRDQRKIITNMAKNGNAIKRPTLIGRTNGRTIYALKIRAWL